MRRSFIELFIAFFVPLYNVFPVAMLVTAGLFRITLLEMTINMGWVFFGFWILSALIWITGNRFFKLPIPGVRGTAMNLLVCGLGLLLLLGARVTTVPAALVREGLRMPRLPFPWVNASLLGFLFLGGLILFLICPKAKPIVPDSDD